MQEPSLDSLLLTEEELRVACKQVEKLAYFKWQEAGSPEGHAHKFWREAELEWIEYWYVPDRYPIEEDA